MTLNHRPPACHDAPNPPHAAIGPAAASPVVRGVIFDFDGVLADTGRGWHLAEQRLRQHFDLPDSTGWGALTHGVGLDESARLLTENADPRPGLQEAAAVFRHLARQNVPRLATRFPGATTTVDMLRSERGPRLQTAIASNTERPLLEELIDGLGLAEAVDHVVSASDVPAPKPAPDIYSTACDLLQTAPDETLVVEDSPTGLRAGQAAGCHLWRLTAEGPEVLLPHSEEPEQAPPSTPSDHDPADDPDGQETMPTVESLVGGGSHAQLRMWLRAILHNTPDDEERPD